VRATSGVSGRRSPPVTVTAQATFLTGSLPAGHGMVANGLFHRDLCRAMFWEQSAALVEGETVWEALKRRRPDARTATLFWQNAIGSANDIVLTPAPIHKHGHGMIGSCYSVPVDLYDRLVSDLGVSKAEGVRRIVAILRDLDYDLNRVIIDHNTEATIALSRGLPVWTGLTVYPYSKLDPKRAAAIARQYGLQRMLVNSSADWGVSDPCSLARVADHMRAEGLTGEDITKLLFDNPLAFWGQCDRFRPDLDLKPVPIEEFQR